MIDFELQKLIDSIDSDTDFSDEIFFRLEETSDVLENAQLLAKIQRKCDEVGRGKEFETLLKGWKAKVKELQKPLPKPFEAVTANELMEQDFPNIEELVLKEIYDSTKNTGNDSDEELHGGISCNCS